MARVSIKYEIGPGMISARVRVRVLVRLRVGSAWVKFIEKTKVT